MIVATNIHKELEKIGQYRDVVIENAKEDARTKGTQILGQYFSDLFESNPKLTHVFVTGFTPGWNDGEECYHDTRVYIHNDMDGFGEMGEFLEYQLNWDIDYDNPSPEFAKINAGISKSESRDIEDELPVHAMSSAFGTDWLVTATRDGVTIQEFNVGY